MKKLLVLLLVMTMAASFAACGAAAPAPAPAAPAAPAPEAPAAPSALNIAVFYYDFSDIYISTVRSNLDKELTALGVAYQNYDAANNQTTQAEQINTAIAGGANLLIVNQVDTSSVDAAQAAVDAANGAGIPIIFFNREIDSAVVNSYANAAFVGTNAPEAGHLQGQMVGEFLLANYDAVDLNKDGTISYVMFKGQEGNAEAEARTQFGVEDADAALTAGGKPALAFYDSGNADKYLVDQNGSWSPAAAQEYMTTILSQYSEANGNMIELVIANNDGMAEGAISALETAGYNTGAAGVTVIPVFGVDATDTAKQLIADGKMTGTVMQDAVGMATTISALVKNVQGGSALMDNTGSFNVDSDVAKIRVPYGKYTG
jgi:methyl-galactoside transport system substrate-binding protein